MIRKELVCVTTKNRYDIGPMFEGSPASREKGIASPVEVIYDYDAVKAKLDLSKWLRGPRSIWKFADLLPLSDPSHAVSLGEGDTPLLRLRALDEETGLENIYIKNETSNPTWSFKDRLNAVSVSMARELGFKKVACATTGNHGTSLAAYSAAAGMQCAIFCHPQTPQVQHDLIRSYGARSIVLKERTQYLSTLVRDYGYYPATTQSPMPVSNPFGVEGYKTIAYEVNLQLDGRVPDRIYAPVAAGDGLYGIWKGMTELKTMGIVDRLPRMFGCQAKGCNPFVRSFKAKRKEVKPVRNPTTDALSISDPTGGDCALDAIYTSKGAATDASEEEILYATKLLARGGIAVELASAVPVACAIRAAKKSEIGPRELVVCILTGAAMKWPDTLDRTVDEPVVRDPNFEELRLALWL